MLYLGLGDGGAANDPERNAQDPATLLGKLLRLDPDDGSVPPDNPFVDRDGFAPEIYALGLRNPWRFSFDRETGDLWVADVGQNSVEEINVTPADRSAGRNYGWDIFEGTQPFEGDEQPERAVVPVHEYPTAEGCAVTGGFVYRGTAIEGLQGAYVYGDFCAGFVRALRVADGEVVDRADLGVGLDQLASFGEDHDGELYLLSLAGDVMRLVPAG
jgi:glucose/arabinose dehydrogenase